MVQDLSTTQILERQLTEIFGQALPEQELSSCLKQAKFLEPKSGSLFWQSVHAETGIYIILKGKARWLDSDENLLATLGEGMSFGELTLFAQEDFHPYGARASLNLKLCYFPGELVQGLIEKHPALEERLHQQAILKDLLLLCRQKLPGQNFASVDGMLRTLSLLEPHRLNPGKLPNSLEKRQKVWLVRSGELVDSSGRRLTCGSFYALSQITDREDWRASEPTEIYSLREADWDQAVGQWPQLEELIQSNPAPIPQEQQSRKRVSPPLSKSNLSKPNIEPKDQPKPRQAYFPNPSLRAGHLWQRVTGRYPFFQQQSAADCGAACLVMVGRYWGKNFSLNRLRDIANVDRNGSSLRSLSAAAESIGFSPRPIKASLDKLAEQQLPAIAHWEGNHYVVVYEINRQRVIIGDPAVGQRSLSRQAFTAGWTGYALLLQPTVRLKGTKEASSSFWGFFELAKPHWRVLAEILIASILIQIFGLATPILTQLLLDRVVVQRSEVTLVAVGLGLLIFGLFRVAMNGLRQYLLDHTANRIDLSLIVGFIAHTLRLPLSFFESRYVGDIMARVQENTKIQRFLTGDALSTFLDLLTVFIYMGMMFWYSWKLALLVLIVIPPFFLLALIATPFLKRISREIFNAVAVESSYLIESLTGIRTVKSMAVEQSVRWHWEELLNKSMRKKFSGQVIANQLQIFSGTLQTLSSTALLWFGAWLVIQNQLTIGQLVAFNMLLGNVISPFQRLAGLWNQLQEITISVERINDVLDSEPEEDLEYEVRQRLPRLRGHICFEQVTFRYHPESQVNVLENVSFTIQPGQTIAIVGRSGSGKTTLAKLLLGLYAPTEGKILLDGYDLTTVSLHSLRQQIGVVDQDTFLFGGTVRENITTAHPEATLEEVMAAAEQAAADSFIQRLPMGYETKIGEGGNLLSGGQRQRLAIARALLGNPALLIFDEATSHLDAESERLIQTNLHRLLQGRTTIVIAHRLSTVRQADLILVLERGVLVESGTHQELMAKRGHYFYLNQQQIPGIA